MLLPALLYTKWIKPINNLVCVHFKEMKYFCVYDDLTKYQRINKYLNIKLSTKDAPKSRKIPLADPWGPGPLIPRFGGPSIQFGGPGEQFKS